jgi:hypothetical protein
MKTDDLINVITQDAPTALPSITRRIGAALLIGGLLALALFTQVLGVRPDIARALQTWRFDAKLITTLLCVGVALWVTMRVVRPGTDPARTVGAMLLPLLTLAGAIACELAATPADTWSVRAIGTNSRLCLVSITVLAVAPLAALLVALRAGAPRSPAMAGAAAGLLAGGLAATLYAVHCPDDSPLFVALWYTLAMAVVAAAGAAIGHHVLRW